jgi:hypothetical protein
MSTFSPTAAARSTSTSPERAIWVFSTITTASALTGSIPPVWIKAHCPIPSEISAGAPIGTSPAIFK